MAYAQAVLGEKLRGIAGAAKCVGDANASDGHGIVLRHELRYRCPEPADDRVVFCGDDRARFARGREHGVFVERFYGVHIEYAHAYPLPGQFRGCRKRQRHHYPARNQREVPALPQRDGFTQLEGLLGIVNHGRRVASHAEVHGTVQAYGLAQQGRY